MSAQVRPGYKLTDIGVFPTEWNVKKLGEITTLMTNGFVGTATSAYVKSDDGVLYVQGFNVEPNSFNFRGIKRVSATFHAQNQKSCLRTGDLLTIQTGDIGATTIIPPSLAGANCHALVISRFDLRRSSSEFYCQYFNSDEGRAAFKVIETGTTMKHLNVGDMVRLLVPSPPLDEQQAIATTLFDMDALIRGLDQLIAKKRDIKQAAMQQLLTGQQRLPGFSGEWEVKPIGEAIDLLSGFPFASNSYSASGVKLLRGSNVKRGQTDWSDEITQFWPSTSQETAKYEIRVGDLVVSMDGSLVGRSYARIVEGDLPALLLQRVARIRSKNIDIGYLSQFVGSQYFINHCDSVKTVTAIPHISANDIRSFSIPTPPTFEEQAAIATILSDMDSELAILEARRDKARQLKQGMMQELLTGRVRLI